jgi:hypothetical protein
MHPWHSLTILVYRVSWRSIIYMGEFCHLFIFMDHIRFRLGVQEAAPLAVASRPESAQNCAAGGVNAVAVVEFAADSVLAVAALNNGVTVVVMARTSRHAALCVLGRRMQKRAVCASAGVGEPAGLPPPLGVGVGAVERAALLAVPAGGPASGLL